MNKSLIYHIHAIGSERISKMKKADKEALAVSFNATPEEVEAEITEYKADSELHWKKATTPEEPIIEVTPEEPVTPVLPEGGSDAN